MKLLEFIHADAIVVSLAAADRDGVIGELVGRIAEAGGLDPSAVEEVTAAIVRRERNGSTGFGKGVAVPHAKHPKVAKLVGAVGLSPAGIDFAALDHRPVHSVFLLLSPQGQDHAHLQAMETIFRSLNKDLFRRALRQADSREKLVALLEETDAGRSP